MSSRLERLMSLWETNPDDAFLLFAIAKEHEKAGDDAQALEWYLRLRRAHPAYVGLYYHLGRLYERLGRRTQALEAYQAGMAVAREAGDGHTWAELNAACSTLYEEDA